jgi:hypothetical protein
MYTGLTYNLYRYDGFNITGSTISDGWETDDAYVWEREDIFSAETRFSGYTIVNDIVELNSGPIDMLYDYQQKKYCMRAFHYRKGWTGLTNDEKMIVIDWHGYPDQGNGAQDYDKVLYLMTVKGMSQGAAVQYITNAWHSNWVKFLQNCPDRWGLLVKTVAEYLSLSDATDLSDTVETLKGQYLMDGRLGLDYGDSQNGIMDYIMATNLYEGDGLEHNLYTLNKGTWETFKNDLEDVMVCEFFLDEIKVNKPTV